MSGEDVTMSWERLLFDKEAALVRAEEHAADARFLLNKAVAEARAAGVPTATIARIVGWKQRKSVFDAIKAYERMMGR